MGTDDPQPPPGAAPDWTVPQAWADYTRDEHAIWDRLFARQVQILAGPGAPAFLQGLDILRLSKPGSQTLTNGRFWHLST